MTVRHQPTPARRAAAIVIGIVVLLTIVLLRRQGRRWWCACGRGNLWAGNIHSAHNSQHLLEPYSFTHVLHGMGFAGLLTLILPQSSWRWRLALALLLEAAWELAENTDAVIQRYRSTTLALGYEGDTVANALGDLGCCAAGLLLARRLGWRRSALVFVGTEAVLLIWIRDSLLLNILMLIAPVEAIKVWQMGQRS
jgi:hypothetical protein